MHWRCVCTCGLLDECLLLASCGPDWGLDVILKQWVLSLAEFQPYPWLFLPQSPTLLFRVLFLFSVESLPRTVNTSLGCVSPYSNDYTVWFPWPLCTTWMQFLPGSIAVWLRKRNLMKGLQLVAAGMPTLGCQMSSSCGLCAKVWVLEQGFRMV